MGVGYPKVVEPDQRIRRERAEGFALGRIDVPSDQDVHGVLTKDDGRAISDSRIDRTWTKVRHSTLK